MTEFVLVRGGIYNCDEQRLYSMSKSGVNRGTSFAKSTVSAAIKEGNPTRFPEGKKNPASSPRKMGEG